MLRLDVGWQSVAIILCLTAYPSFAIAGAPQPLASMTAPAMVGEAGNAAVPTHSEASAGLSGDAQQSVTLILGFESRSNRLTAADIGALDRLVVALQSDPTRHLLVVAPSPRDRAIRNFVASRLAVVERELLKRGVAGKTVKIARPNDNDDAIVLCVAPRALAKTPVEISPASFDLPRDAGAAKEQTKDSSVPIAHPSGADIEKSLVASGNSGMPAGLAPDPDRVSPLTLVPKKESERTPEQAKTDIVAAEIWVASVGQSLRAVLQDWGRRAGWTIVWQSDREYPIDAPASFSGDFLNVASQLLSGFSTATPMPAAHFFKGNHVVLVVSGEGR